MQAGYPRFTGDIDLLVDASPANEARVFAALELSLRTGGEGTRCG
jgi:hypothetical protein